MLSKEERISPVDFPSCARNDGQCAGERTERMEIGFPEALKDFFNECCQDEYVEKKYFPFRENGRREGERMVATPTESTIRSICSEDKMVPVCSCYCVNIKRGRCFLFFLGIKNKPKILPVAKYEVQLPGSRAVLILPDGRKVDLENEVLRSDLAQSDSLLLISTRSLKYRDIDSPDTTEVFHTLEIPRGGEYLLTLSDGTIIYLNSESTLSFPVKFQGKERKVYLTGEAYFKVAKNTEHPFVVTAGELEVLVTGTRSWCSGILLKTEKDIQTTLESGQVTVRVEGKSVKLVPNKQVLFNKLTMGVEVRDVDVDLYLAWADGRLVYDNCPLEKILTDLGRWYNIDVFYSRDELRFIPIFFEYEKTRRVYPSIRIDW